MRSDEGLKSGLEKRIRDEKQGHLLDIDGDSCHHIHNGAKLYCKPFEGYLENLFTQIHTDHKWSPELRKALAEVCTLLSIKFTAPDVHIPWRWLSCYNVSVSTLRLLDPYIVFYYSFLSPADKGLYKIILENIYERNRVSREARAQIKIIQDQLSSKTLTEDGKNRKRKICEKLIFKSTLTKLCLHFYSFGLEFLKKYVCLFQSKEPLIHCLHDKQLEVFKELLSCFIKPERLNFEHNREVQGLVSLDIKNSQNHLSQDEVLYGPKVSSIAKKLHKNDSTLRDFYEKAKQAYVDCAVYLQKKLPLQNQLLQTAMALDPVVKGHTTTLKYLKSLPRLVSTVLTETECEEYLQEVHKLQSASLLSPVGADGKPVRADYWWGQAKKKYPCVGKMALAVLTCFHGAQVESSFSTMGDIVDSKSGNIRTDTYSSLQTVRYGLRSTGKTSVEYFRRDDKLHSPFQKDIVKNIQSSKRKYETEKKDNEEKARLEKVKLDLDLESIKLTKAKAKLTMSIANKKAKLAHKRKMEQLVKPGKKRKL